MEYYPNKLKGGRTMIRIRRCALLNKIENIEAKRPTRVFI